MNHIIHEDYEPSGDTETELQDNSPTDCDVQTFGRRSKENDLTSHYFHKPTFSFSKALYNTDENIT